MKCFFFQKGSIVMIVVPSSTFSFYHCITSNIHSLCQVLDVIWFVRPDNAYAYQGRVSFLNPFSVVSVPMMFLFQNV